MSTGSENFEQAAVGRKIKDFTLETYEPATDSFGELSFAEVRKDGKWLILVFYPADFTFVCPTELADLAEHLKPLQEAGAVVASVSTDTKFSHLAWRRSERLLQNVSYAMASDHTGEAARYFNVYGADGTALRGTFIINPEGMLVGSEINYYNVGRNAAELVRKVQAFNHLRANPFEVCPARWEPGDKTLKPLEKLVGKVYEDLNS